MRINVGMFGFGVSYEKHEALEYINTLKDKAVRLSVKVKDKAVAVGEQVKPFAIDVAISSGYVAAAVLEVVANNSADAHDYLVKEIVKAEANQMFRKATGLDVTVEQIQAAAKDLRSHIEASL
jgi:hypothetical protein